MIRKKKKKSVKRLKRTAFLPPSLAQNREENQPIRRKDINPTPSQPKNMERGLILVVNNSIKTIKMERQKENLFNSLGFM